MSKGSALIISGPSGSGKDTILKKVFEKMPELKFSISSPAKVFREIYPSSVIIFSCIIKETMYQYMSILS